MATRKDEFDPPVWLLAAVVEQIAVPELGAIANEIGVSCLAAVAVCVCEHREVKLNLIGSQITRAQIVENTEVRLRFRKTYRDDRVLFAMDTQHADVWRKTGFSGIWLRGDILILGTEVKCKSRHKTICYNQAWHDW